MRARIPVIVAAAAALLAAIPANAATKTLDGKKTKVLTFKDVVAKAQDNDRDVVSAADRTSCAAPRCARFTFRYLPAKGVRKGPFSVRIAWTLPVEDYDLYVVQDNAGEVAQCGAGAGTSETAVIPTPVPGHRYTVIVDHFRALPDTVTVNVAFPATAKVATAVPSNVDDKVEPINCGIS
jgi:hypothetical protein